MENAAAQAQALKKKRVSYSTQLSAICAGRVKAEVMNACSVCVRLQIAPQRVAPQELPPTDGAATADAQPPIVVVPSEAPSASPAAHIGSNAQHTAGPALNASTLPAQQQAAAAAAAAAAGARVAPAGTARDARAPPSQQPREQVPDERVRGVAADPAPPEGVGLEGLADGTLGHASTAACLMDRAKRHRLWRIGVPASYSYLAQHNALLWPTQSVQLLPGLRTSPDGLCQHRLLYGTQTDGQEDNFLILAEVGDTHTAWASCSGRTARKSKQGATQASSLPPAGANEAKSTRRDGW